MVKSTLSAGIPLGLGSDAPLNPFLNVMFATMHPGQSSEALTLERAVVAYPQGSAIAEFQEKDKGVIGVGMLAALRSSRRTSSRRPRRRFPAPRGS